MMAHLTRALLAIAFVMPSQYQTVDRTNIDQQRTCAYGKLACCDECAQPLPNRTSQQHRSVLRSNPG